MSIFIFRVYYYLPRVYFNGAHVYFGVSIFMVPVSILACLVLVTYAMIFYRGSRRSQKATLVNAHGMGHSPHADNFPGYLSGETIGAL